MLLLLFFQGDVTPLPPEVFPPFPDRTTPVYQYTGRPSRDDYCEPRYTMYCEPPDFAIDPDSTQRIRFPLASELDGETIIDADIILEDGLTLGTVTINDSSVTALLSDASEGSIYRVTVRYVTSAGQTLDKTFRLLAEET